jgi:uncharacterized protein
VLTTGPAWRTNPPANDRTIYRYRSAALGDELEITVVPPVGAPGLPAPVIYVLDPFLTLDVVVGWSRVYGLYSEGALPPAYVVGIGHPTADEQHFSALRVRDLTPTPVTGREWQPRLGAGQGPKLLAAIASEVVPFVEKNLAATGDRTIIGWSLGGLFGLYALFHEPGLFSRYLLVSPSLWWENRLPLAWEKDWASRHDDLDARVFLAVGAREQAPGGGWLSEGFPDDLLAWFAQVTNFRALTRRLKSRGYPGLRFDSVVFADEYHMTVYPGAVARGLVQLFSDPKGG